MAARSIEPAKAGVSTASVVPSEQDQLGVGPLSILMRSVKHHTQVLINLRNNHKVIGVVRAFDRHCNMVLENVKELWKEVPPGGKKAITRDRIIPKLFLRGDSVIVVVSGESFKASGAADSAAPGSTSAP